MTSSMTEDLAALQQRNERLTETLRQTRDQMIEMKSVVDKLSRSEAIMASLEYAIIAINTRIAAIKTAFRDGTTGSEHDPAMHRVPNELVADTFEAALLGAGFRIVPVFEVVS